VGRRRDPRRIRDRRVHRQPGTGKEAQTMTRADKAAFVRRMAAARKKAPKKKAAKRSAPKKTAKKKAAKKNPAKGKKLTGKAKAAFLKRMAKGRKAAPKKAVLIGLREAPKKNRRRNPDMTEAERKFEEFHGRPANRTIEYEQNFVYPAELAEMGRLKELRFELDPANPDFELSGFGACQAVCTPDGANIYFIGGDQSIDMRALDLTSDKDMVELGACVYIRYHTVKGFHDFEPIEYEHEFGEEDGILPILAYDRLNKTLFLISGNYRVRPEGICN
jgi:hypothetical protein